MFYIVIFIILIIIFFLLKRNFSNSKTQKLFFKWLIVLFLSIATVFLVLRFGYAFLSFLLPILYIVLRNKIANFISGFLNFSSSNTFFKNKKNSEGENNYSEVNTDTLSMRLYHDSGKIDGLIKRGKYTNKKLLQLDESQLIELMIFCLKNDEKSVDLLEAYLDRMTEFNWREKIDLTDRESQKQSQNSGVMSKEEAYQILGLNPGSDREEIKDAYHRLMVKFHPDRGGTDFLASKINQAKDLLLKDF